MRDYVRAHLLWTRKDVLRLPLAADQFKDAVLENFLPGAEKPRARAEVLRLTSDILNADWRHPVLQHFCLSEQCCSDREACVAKLEKSLVRVARMLKPPMVCKGNWSAWPAHLQMFGLLSHLHCILRSVLQKTLGHVRDNVDAGADVGEDANVLEGGGLQAAEDVLAAKRREKAHSLQVASDCVASAGWEGNLFLFRTALAPQIALMSTLLQSDSREFELQQLDNLRDQGSREYNVVRLATGADTLPMLQQTMQTVQCEQKWRHLPCTESHQSQVLQSCMRPAAFIWRLLHLRCTNLPTALFALVKDPTPARAAALLETPLCRRDAFSRKFLNEHNTVERLTSANCIQLLTAAAFLIRGTTFSTERAHSKNSRRARMRVQTHAMQAYTLALPHAAGATPRWLHPQYVSDLKRVAAKRGRPSKRTLEQAGDGGAADNDGPRRRSGGGGAWRAFLKHRLAGRQLPKSVDGMEALVNEYRNLGEHDRRMFKHIGTAGAQDKGHRHKQILSHVALHLSCVFLSFHLCLRETLCAFWLPVVQKLSGGFSGMPHLLFQTAPFPQQEETTVSLC